jgi:RNA polymerase sigma-70 factor (ECF subfamily)
MIPSGSMAARPTSVRLVQRQHPEPSGTGAVQFDALFQRYAEYVAGIAARLLGRDDHEVDDIVQDVFSIAWRNVGRIHHMDAARPWLVTVTVRIAGRRLRRRRWRNLFLGEADVMDLPASGASPEQHALLQRIYRVLDTLNGKDRIAWLLRYAEGERLENVAAACGCSLATAKRRIASVQSVLQEVLRDA